MVIGDDKMIKSRAPVRISFAGGGTDVSPYTEEHEGCVINASINKYAYGSLENSIDIKITTVIMEKIKKIASVILQFLKTGQQLRMIIN